MTVAVDAVATTLTLFTVAGTSANNTTLTVGASATSLIAVLATNVAVTSPSMTWNGVALTEIGHFNGTSGFVWVFGMVNPASGNHTLAASWTGSEKGILDCLSFTGSATTFASAFRNFNTSSLTGTSTTLTLTGASGNLSFCVASEIVAQVNTLTATSGTSALAWTNSSTVGCRAATVASASSLTWTAVPNASCNVVMCGVDVAVDGMIAYQPWRQLAPILAQ